MCVRIASLNAASGDVDTASTSTSNDDSMSRRSQLLRLERLRLLREGQTEWRDPIMPSSESRRRGAVRRGDARARQASLQESRRTNTGSLRQLLVDPYWMAAGLLVLTECWHRLVARIEHLTLSSPRSRAGHGGGDTSSCSWRQWTIFIGFTHRWHGAGEGCTLSGASPLHISRGHGPCS